MLFPNVCTLLEVGYLLAIIGFVVLPVNLLIGFLGRYIEDRTISFFALAFLTSGNKKYNTECRIIFF